MGVFVDGVVMAKAKDGYSWVHNRYRPDQNCAILVTTIVSGNLRLRSASDGALPFISQFVNLSRDELTLITCHLSYWQFNGRVMLMLSCSTCRSPMA